MTKSRLTVLCNLVSSLVKSDSEPSSLRVRGATVGRMHHLVGCVAINSYLITLPGVFSLAVTLSAQISTCATVLIARANCALRTVLSIANKAGHCGALINSNYICSHARIWQHVYCGAVC